MICVMISFVMSAFFGRKRDVSMVGKGVSFNTGRNFDGDQNEKKSWVNGATKKKKKQISKNTKNTNITKKHGK